MRQSTNIKMGTGNLSIAFDARIDTGGLGRYVGELAGGLRKRGGRIQLVEGGWGHWIFWEQIVLPLLLLRARPNIYHAAQNWGVPIFCPCPVVVTIHDVIPESFPGYFDRSRNPGLSKFLYHLRIQVGLWRARRVVCVSETTKQEVQKYFWIDEKKLVVVYNGANSKSNSNSGQEGDKTLRKFRLMAGEYLLNHGGIERRKNLVRLIIAFDKATRNDRKMKLVITGGGQGKEHLEELVKELGMDERVVFTGWVSDGEIGVLVRGVRAVVYPTLAEGFGLPALEAMAAGVPVVASDIPVLREIGGEVPIYVDPRSVESISRGIGEAIGKRERPRKLEKFSWGTSLDNLERVYSEALGD